MDKVSRYTIIGDMSFSNALGTPFRIVYATRTAKLIPVTLDVAQALVNGDAEAVPPDTAAILRTLEILVPADEDELETVLRDNRKAAHEIGEVQFGLLPTSFCNMGCAYCGQEHTRGGLSSEHRDRVRARVLRVLKQPTTKVARIDWFGAEPMIGYPMIRDLAKDFVKTADERGIVYDSSIVTNGSLLTPERIRVLVRECRVNRFVITIDGPAEVHDAHRPLKKGGGSFRKIVRTLQHVVEDPSCATAAFQLRTNVDVHNQARVAEYLDLMADLGFARANVSFEIHPVHSWGNDVADIEVGKRDYADRELRWLRLMDKRGLNTKPLLPSRRKKVVCPAVSSSSELISSTGNIFSCSEHPLVPEAERSNALGHLQDDLPLFRPEGLFDRWNDAVARGESWCNTCPFLPVCGGACPKAWQEGNPPCPSYKLNIQGRMELMAARRGWSADL